MDVENTADESIELGRKIMSWLNEMPDLPDLHKMLISIAMVSTTDNGGVADEPTFKAIAEWAQMLCQNLELVALFRAGHLIARASEDGEMEVDFSKEAAKIIASVKKEAAEIIDSVKNDEQT